MSCVLKAIADAPRRTILRSLRTGALPAGTLGELAHVPEGALAEHLRVLQRAGLLSERRDPAGPRYLLERERVHQLALRLRTVVTEA
jgi:DNA-binding transcriptional ArsR family regulator